jgi:hypothetical protein
MEMSMHPRWNDRIQVMKPKPISYDAWGHPLPQEWESDQEYWANVCLNLTAPLTAIVTVRQPFKYDHTIQIEWQEQRWRLMQDPLVCSNNSKLIQFKIEALF